MKTVISSLVLGSVLLINCGRATFHSHPRPEKKCLLRKSDAGTLVECPNSNPIFIPAQVGPKGDTGEVGKDGVNGTDGKDGVNGVNGKDGIDGKDGVDGKDGQDGIDGQDGKDGVDGQDGQDGEDGKDGVDGQDGADAVLEVINPCGVEGPLEELILRLNDGKLYAVYYSHSAHDVFLTELVPGNYVTTDSYECHFTVTTDLNVVY